MGLNPCEKPLFSFCIVFVFIVCFPGPKSFCGFIPPPRLKLDFPPGAWWTLDELGKSTLTDVKDYSFLYPPPIFCVT